MASIASGDSAVPSLDSTIFSALKLSIDECAAATDTWDLHRCIARFACDLDFDLFFFLMTFSLSFLRRRTIVVHSYPREWTERYHANNYYSIDPVFGHCRESTTPIFWDQIQPKSGAQRRRSDFMNEVHSFGIRNGVTFPIHGGAIEWGMLSLNSAHGEPLDSRRAMLVQLAGRLFSGYLQEAARRIVGAPSLQSADEQLTVREKECLCWSAEGKTAWETGKILRISERTVVFHLQKAMEKFGVNNRVQAAVCTMARLSTDPDVVRSTIDLAESNAVAAAMP